MENVSLYKEELSEDCAKYISPQTRLKMWKFESWTQNWVKIQMRSPPWRSAPTILRTLIRRQKPVIRIIFVPKDGKVFIKS